MKKIPPAAFFIVYMGSIFVFAWLYTSMPYEFYHGTVKYEREIQGDFITINQSIKNLIKSRINEVDSSGYIQSNELMLRADRLEVSNVDLQNQRLTFDLFFHGEIDSTRWIYGSQPAIMSFGKLSSDSIDKARKGTLSLICHDDTVQTHSVLFEKIFPDYPSVKVPGTNYYYPQIIANGGCSNCYDCGYVFLPDSVNQLLINYSNALNGFPSYSSGDFERMFYLSAVTITTVGYGDIVPITKKARLCIAIEAIWGIILIGLFLNSIAYQITKNR